MSDDLQSILLTDFGGAYFQRDSTYSTVPCTLVYMAPERFGENLPSSKSDLWSCGVVIYELIHLRKPFRTLEELISKQTVDYDDSALCAKMGDFFEK